MSRKDKAKIRWAYAIGVVIDLGYCLDLISTTGIEFVKRAYSDLKIYIRPSPAVRCQQIEAEMISCSGIWTAR